MNNLYVEIHPIKEDVTLSWNLAHHIYTRMREGRIIIITNKPNNLLSATKKQWNKLLRRVERERASTISSTKRAELNEQVAIMKSFTFSAKPPADPLEANVTFGTINEFLRTPPYCNTAYFTYPISKEDQYVVTSWMPARHGLVVIFNNTTNQLHT